MLRGLNSHLELANISHMTRNTTINLYRKQYSDIQFERAGLFELIQKKYKCNEVLYPGCSVHITASLFFPHVIYVDLAPSAKKFFADMDSVSPYVNSNKKYKRSSYIRLINQDYSRDIPVRENEFDLLISLFAEGISRTCKKYLKSGGILLTHNHHNDAVEAAVDDEFKLISVVRYRGGAYTVIDDNLEAFLTHWDKSARKKKYTKRAQSGIEYIEDEDYFIFKKRRPRKLA